MPTTTATAAARRTRSTVRRWCCSRRVTCGWASPTTTERKRRRSASPCNNSCRPVMPGSHSNSLRSPRVTLLASCLLAVLASFGTAQAADSVATGKRVLEPGAAAFADQQGTESFGNAAIEARWKLDGQRLVDFSVTDRVHGRTFQVPAPFALALADGSTLKAAD